MSRLLTTPTYRLLRCDDIPLWHGSPEPDRIHWIGLPSSADSGVKGCITDDFGVLVLLANSLACLDARTHFWADCPDIDESAVDWKAHRREAERAARQQEQQALDTRALLRPIKIECVIEDADEHGTTAIHVGPDPRYGLGTPVYCVHCGGNDPIYISHAQLSALMVVAQALCKASQAPGQRGGVH